MSSSTIRKALGAVKDQTSIGLAKVTSNIAPELDVLIVKVTSHDDEPAEERHIREILHLTSGSRAHVAAAVAGCSRRLSRTRDYVVALKSLMLVHRLLADGDPSFHRELLHATRRGTRLLNLSDFRDEAHSGSWDHSAFVRTYALYLDQRLEFFLHDRKQGSNANASSSANGPSPRDRWGSPDPYGRRSPSDSSPPGNGYGYGGYDDYRERNGGNTDDKSPPTPVRDMKPERVLARMHHLQQLLDRFLACRPTGGAKHSRMVLVALYQIVRQSFQLYADICEVLAVLLDRFFDMEYAECVKAFEAYASAAKQIDELCAFYAWCKDTGVARSSEYPEVQRVTDKLLETLEEFMRDRAKRPKSPPREPEPEPEPVKAEEPEPDMNSIKALPAPEDYKEPEPEKVEEEVKPEPPPQPQGDLVDLREDTVTADEQGNRLALALFQGPPAAGGSNGSWEAFPSNGGNEVTSAWQTPAAEPGKADWELALVETASNLSKQKATMSGGMDPLLLNGMYDQGAVRQHVNAQVTTGSASSVAGMGEDASPLSHASTASFSLPFALLPRHRQPPVVTHHRRHHRPRYKKEPPKPHPKWIPPPQPSPMASPAATADSDSDSNPSRPNAPVPITVPSPRAHLHHHHLLDRRDTPRARAWEPEGTLRPRPGAMDGAAKPEAKLVAGEAGYVLEDVPHVSDYLPDLPTYPNPLQDNPAYSVVKQYFVNPDDTVCQKIVVHKGGPRGNHFRRAGPRQKVYFESDEVHACIVTCGGLCPGLNTVIREIVCGLSDMYGVTKILGIQGGYRGFYARNTIDLTPKSVNDIHKRGGTILGTSRGGHDTMKIVDSIQDRGINQVYVIGGDGTQRGAGVIFEEVRKRGLKVAVAGIPKTIDNDIPVIDKSFGFDTAVEEAQRAINAAHVEAQSAENGIGLVKLMGRYSGFIAHYATLASRDVDCCLIPESPFYLEGEGGLFKYMEKRLKENGHMVIVVAEGAGQKLIAETMQSMGQDASGNALLLDVGLWLSQQIKEHFKKNKTTINLKYIDPTYMIRAIPSNASDNVYCTLLAHSVVHGAMAGYTGFTVGQVNGRHCYIPFYRITEKQNKVSITDRIWARLLSSTNQPSFLSKKDVDEAKLEDERTTKLLDGPPSNPKVEDEVAPSNSNGVK